MRTIIVLKGIPGSGKSTWAKKEMSSHRGKYKRFNRDEMRSLMDCEYNSPENESFIVSLRDQGTEMALTKGFDVIIDDTNFNEKNFLAMCEIAERIGDVRVMEKFFEVTLKQALSNNRQRQNPVPDHIVESMYDKHIKHSRVLARDEYYPPVTRPIEISVDRSKSMAVICDLDGTLAIALDRDYYDASQVETDTVNDFVLRQLCLHINSDDEIIFVTGRSESSREKTELWLNKIMNSLRDLKYVSMNDTIYREMIDSHQDKFVTVEKAAKWKVIYRSSGDSRPDSVVKQELYEKHIKDFYNIVAVYDDRKSVVQAWRKLGLPVFQVFDTNI